MKVDVKIIRKKIKVLYREIPSYESAWYALRLLEEFLDSLTINHDCHV